MPRPRRSAVAALLALLLLVGVPGLAAAKIIVVDDDRSGSYQRCDATGVKAKGSIQAAIDAAGPGDTVWVCPGTYPGVLHIEGDRDGLALVSARSLGATIRGDGAEDLDRAIWVDDVDDVTITGFRIRTIRGDGIWIRDSRRALVSENDIRPARARGLPHLLDEGVAVWIGGSGRVLDNTIVDSTTGVSVRSDSHASVRRNTIEFRFGTRTAAGLAGIAFDGTGVVQDNVIVADLLTTPISGPDSKLFVGIEVFSQDGQTIRGNTIKRARTGIKVTSPFPSRGSALIVDNLAATSRDQGLYLIAAKDAEIRGNRFRAVTLPGYGAFVDASSGNLLIGNDFRGSAGPDIKDPVDAVYPNTWTDNLADDCEPSSRC